MRSITLDPNMTGRDADRLLCDLGRLIVGQEEAVQQIVSTYQMYLTGMLPQGRPIGNFLFLGPTGSGKTRAVEATAQCLLGSPRAVVKIDCAEFQHSHEIAKLIGSPPGYLGHRETHPLLSQENINQHHTSVVRIGFVLFDEIEKASDSLWNLLLGILDKATLTLGDNRKVDFSQAMIFMTSNLGATEMSSLVRPRLGFSPAAAGEVNDKLNQKLSRSGVEAARRRFTPEFINRLDKIVVFKPLGERQLRRILDIELNAVQQRIVSSANNRTFMFTVTDDGKQFLLDEGFDLKYGARHLKRAIERLLVQPMSNLIATDQIRGGDWIQIDHLTGSAAMSFRREAEGLPVRDIARLVDRPDVLSDMASASATRWDIGKVQTIRSSK